MTEAQNPFHTMIVFLYFLLPAKCLYRPSALFSYKFSYKYKVDINRIFLAIVIQYQSVLIIGPGGLRAPSEVAFSMRSWPLLLLTFVLFFSLSFTSIAFDSLQGNS